MIQLVKGMVVRSRQGHDKGSFFVVADICDDIVLLTDGASRSLENPKRKNPLHGAPTKTVLAQDRMTVSEIRSTLAAFNSRVRTS